MIIEVPQAETCCGFLTLRAGVIIIIIIRIILLILVILFGAKVITLGHDPDPGPDPLPEECYKLYHMHTAELVIVTVTVVLLVLWLITAIPAVIWEMLSMILIACVLELFIWAWFFFILAYHLSLAIVRNDVNFMLLYSIICLLLECFILWIMWSYYVDVKDELKKARRETSSSLESSDIPL